MHWTVQDFKGLHAGSLELNPGVLTVLTGANSSGKSSLIQSILLTAQTLHHDGPIALNGPLTRLGEAVDLVRKGSKSTQVAIRLDRQVPPGWDDFGETVNEADAELIITIDLRPHAQDGRIAVHSVRIRTDGDEENELAFSKENMRTSDVEQIKLIAPSPDVDILHLKSHLDPSERQLRTYLLLSGLHPLAIVQLASSQQTSKKYKRLLLQTIKRARNSKLLDQFGILNSFNMYATEREVDRLTRQALTSPESNPATTSITEFQSAKSRTETLKIISALDPQKQAKTVDELSTIRSSQQFTRIPLRAFGARRRSHIPRYDMGLIEQELFSKLESSIRALAEYSSSLDNLSTNVQYLGPLRDEPRVVWSQWNEQARGLPVGSRGEFSAAVLARRASRTMRYRRPDGSMSSNTLNAAVNDWASYLDIGETVSVKNRGKLGIGIELSVGGSQRDLTSVGVGVSQALPLIVALLSSPEGSIFLVEQPELHLHPAVQARLADFILNARPDLAIVVETHSEVLVTRIRRRAAESIVDPSRIRVTFVEKKVTGSETRNLQMSEYGNLSEWPAGFLSNDEDDTSAILIANMARAQTDPEAQ